MVMTAIPEVVTSVVKLFKPSIEVRTILPDVNALFLVSAQNIYLQVTCKSEDISYCLIKIWLQQMIKHCTCA